MRGTTIAPGAWASIWVGVASPRLGRWSLRGFVLRYRVGRNEYRATIHQQIDVRVVRRCADCRF